MQKAIFSSDLLPSHLSHEQRARSWAESLMAAGAWDATVPNSEGFSARSEAVNLINISVSRAQATSIRLERDHRHIRRDDDDSVMLLLNDGGALLGGSQFGGEHVLRQGDAMLLDFAEPHISYAQRGGRAAGVRLPRRLFERMSGPSRTCRAIAIDHRTGALQLLRDYLRLILDRPEPLIAEVAAATERHVTDLLALALDSARPTLEQTDSVSAARTAQIMEQIQRHCTDAALDAEAVGRTLGCSGRSVQLLLQKARTTFSLELREARVAFAERMLADSRHDHLSVAAVAQISGFEDTSTFYRAFHRLRHVSPTDIRQRRRTSDR